MSKNFASVLAAACTLVLGGVAMAATPAGTTQPGKAPTAQQQKLASCSHQSKGIKGDAHKKFMSDCMKGKPGPGAASAGNAQQQKMKDCNAKAKGMQGDSRKDFMSKCLKKS